MKGLLMGLLAVMLMVAPVFGEKHDKEYGDVKFLTSMEGGQFLATGLMGKGVYVTERETVAESVTEVPEGWENVGDVSDFIATRDGKVKGLLFDVGGFLGIGTRAVAVSMKAVKLVDIEETDDFLVVLPGVTREAIEAAPEFELQPTPLPVRRY